MALRISMDDNIAEEINERILVALDDDKNFVETYRSGYHCFISVMSVELEDLFPAMRSTSVNELASLDVKDAPPKSRKYDRRQYVGPVALLSRIWGDLDENVKAKWKAQVRKESAKRRRVWSKIEISTTNHELPNLLKATICSTLRHLQRKLCTQLKKGRLSLSLASKIVFLPERVQLGRGVLTQIGVSVVEFECFWRPRFNEITAPRHETLSWVFYWLKTPMEISRAFTFGDYTLHRFQASNASFCSEMGIRVVQSDENGRQFGYMTSMEHDTFEILFEGDAEPTSLQIYENQIRDASDIQSAPAAEEPDEEKGPTYTFQYTTICYSKRKQELSIIWDRFSRSGGAIDFNTTS